MEFDHLCHLKVWEIIEDAVSYVYKINSTQGLIVVKLWPPVCIHQSTDLVKYIKLFQFLRFLEICDLKKDICIFLDPCDLWLFLKNIS